MKYFLTLLPLIVFCCCSGNKHAKNTDSFDDGGKLFTSIQEPLIAYMEDSFKKWIPVWDSIAVNDRKYRKKDPLVFLDHKAEVHRLDSINVAIVAGFLDRYGFPTKYQSGIKGKEMITMVVQHAPLAIQEKYYPMWVEAYKKNNLTGYTIACLEDRINMQRKRRQYYGTQHMQIESKTYDYPVVNPDSIDAWRKQMGMFPTIEWEYESFYNKKWDAEACKKELPELIKKFNVTDSTPIRFVK